LRGVQIAAKKAGRPAKERKEEHTALGETDGPGHLKNGGIKLIVRDQET